MAVLYWRPAGAVAGWTLFRSKVMILPLFRRAKSAGTISALYGTIVAQARLPTFYSEYGVPDTVDGRFELIVLHLALLLFRLEDESDATRGLGQQIFDEFCRDMDRNLREIGIGDLKVPDEMKRIGAAYYGRARAYRSALRGDGDLDGTVARNVFGALAQGAIRLSAYIKIVEAKLAGQDISAIAGGMLEFPAP